MSQGLGEERVWDILECGEVHGGMRRIWSAGQGQRHTGHISHGKTFGLILRTKQSL